MISNMHKTRLFFWIEIMCVLICTASCEFKCGSEGVELSMDKSGDALRAHQEGLKLLQAHSPEAAAAKFSEAMNLAPGEAAPVVGLCQAYAMGPEYDSAMAAMDP